MRSWGDPNDRSLYLTLDEINAAFTLIDELKVNLLANGELAAFLGWHPPSLFAYALRLADHELESPAMRATPQRNYGAVLWMDGVLIGMLMMLLICRDDD